METHTGRKPIRVLIVDDHPVVRAGLTSLLRKENALKVVGAAQNGEAGLDLIHRSSVDVVLLDLRMPKIGGIDFLSRLREIANPPAVLILSSYAYEEEIYRALKAGARGYLSKDATRAQIVEAISAVNAGGRYLSGEIAGRLAERESRSSLSTRETEILEMVSKGLTNKEIARVLQISQYTVRNHINHISAKLEVGDRTEAVAVAMNQGILSPR
jgi:two-component system, NarL family, response regulator